MTNPNRDAKITQWLEAKQNAAHWEKIELDLRKELAFDTEMFSPTVEKGTLNFTLGNGYALKQTRRINVKVDNKEGKVWTLLQALEQRGEIQHHLAKELFNFDSPALREGKLAELKKVDEEGWKMVIQLITETPGTPSLEFIVPKDKA